MMYITSKMWSTLLPIKYVINWWCMLNLVSTHDTFTHLTSAHPIYQFTLHSMHVIDYWWILNTCYVYHQLMCYQPILHSSSAYHWCMMHETHAFWVKRKRTIDECTFSDWHFSTHDIDLGCISYILSIAAVWYMCHRSMVHANDWYCILRLLSITDACSSWCMLGMMRARHVIFYVICSTCYRSMRIATMRYCNAWGPSISFSINTMCCLTMIQYMLSCNC